MASLRWPSSPPIGRILIYRPERRNAMSECMWRELSRICGEIEDNIDIHAVVVEGVGGNVCSGADIGEFEESLAKERKARTYLRHVEDALEAPKHLERPTIAKICGAAFGGGIAVALACDLRFANQEVQIAIPPARLGLRYGIAETKLLVETVGPAKAKDLLFSARAIDSVEALRIGLTDRRISTARLDGDVAEHIRNLATVSRLSIRGAKKAYGAGV